jgi:hypothetical protein
LGLGLGWLGRGVEDSVMAIRVMGLDRSIPGFATGCAENFLSMMREMGGVFS